MSIEVNEVTFEVGGEQCAARLHRPARRAGSHPAVVLVNGVSLTMRDGVGAFAERFAEHGMAALTFDFRCLGDSDGEPRQRFDLIGNREDLAAAVAFVRGLDEVDADQVAVWGYSLGGGYAVEEAARDDRLAAALALVPMADGLAFTLRAPPMTAVRMSAAAARAALARSDIVLSVCGPPGSLSVLARTEAEEGMPRLCEEGSKWRNEMRAKPSQPAARLRPVRSARKVRIPLWVGVAEQDTVVPRRPIEKLASRAPDAELHSFETGHFGALQEDFEEVVADQLDFLERHLAVDRAA